MPTPLALQADDALPVLILAPIAGDAEAIARALRESEVCAGVCLGMAALIAEISHKTGAIIVAEEALAAGGGDNARVLAAALTAQPEWSDLPVIFLAAPGASEVGAWEHARALETVGNISILERPLRPTTLQSAVAVALRARERQFRLRDSLAQRQQALIRLRESEERTRMATEATGVGTWQWNLLTDTVRWDAQLFRLYGIAPTPDGFVQYSDWSGAVLPEDLLENERILHDTVRRCGESRREFRIRRRNDGEVRVIEAVETARTNEQRQVEWMVGTNLDVTEKRRAEDALHESQQFTRRVLDNLFAFVGVVTVDGILTEVNRAPLEAAGIPAGEVLGKTFWDCYWWSYSPEIQAQVRDACERAAGGEVVRYDVPVRMADDTRVWIDFQVAPLRDNEGRITHLIPSAMDIAVRRAAEETSRASEDRFRAAVSAVSDIIWTNNAEGKMEGEQLAWCAFTGQRQEDYQGFGWSKVVHPDDAQPTIDAWVLAVAQKRPFEFQHRIRRHDGHWRVCSIRAVPVLGLNEKIREWVGVHSDITERRAAEQELLAHRENLERAVEQRTAELAESMAKLVASERLAALGTLAAGLGHDIANMTLPIRLRLDMLARTADSKEAKSNIDAMLRGVEHLNNLSAGMRLLAMDPERAAASAPVADLAHWCSQTTAMFRSAVPRHITVECSVPSGVGVSMPAHRLAQAIFNLVQNAGEAMAGQTAGLIKVSAQVATQPADANLLELRITDDGPGMSPEVLARCFEPYFSTKGRTISTGMGLGIVKGIVEAAGGRVLAESAPGRGTTFTISLPVEPAVDQPTASPSQAPSAAVSIRHARTASMACLFLEQLGFSTVRTPPNVIPEASLWIVDESDLAQVSAFLAGHGHRRVVMLGALGSNGGSGPSHPSESGESDQRGESLDARVVRLPASPAADELRQVLVAAGRDARSQVGEG